MTTFPDERNTQHPSLCLKNVSVGWGGVNVLSDVHLDIDFQRFNRRVPIIGRTGTGKTTLLYALAAQSSPRSGSVEWSLPAANHSAKLEAGGAGAPAAALRERFFSFAFQDAMLVPFLTVAENIRLPLALRRKDMSASECDRRVADLFDQFLIDGEDCARIANRFPTQLSGGQRQRMALAQALATDPLVLFSDEPTGNLDPATRREIMSVVDRWVEADKDRLFFWITHHYDAEEFESAPYVLVIEREGDVGTARIQPSAAIHRPRSGVAPDPNLHIVEGAA